MTGTNLGKALLVIQDAISNPQFDSTNPHFGNKFASLAAHLDAILPVANANGVIVTQEPVALEDGAPALRTRVIHAETFEFIESTMPLAVEKTGPQGQGSAITYARRYSLAAIFGVVGEPDDDGNKAAAASPGGSTGAYKAAVEPATRQAGAVPAGAPAAAPNPVTAAVEKAQAAQVEHKATTRPDLPRHTARTTPKGDTIMEATTFVKPRPDKTTKDGRPIYVFGVVLDGTEVEMTTMSDRTRDDGHRLADTTALVEFIENGRFRNLWAVKPLDGAPAVSGGATSPDDIPFSPVVW